MLRRAFVSIICNVCAEPNAVRYLDPKTDRTYHFVKLFGRYYKVWDKQ